MVPEVGENTAGRVSAGGIVVAVSRVGAGGESTGG